MQSSPRSARIGASMSILGGVLIVFSDFMLDAYHTSLALQVLWLVIPPVLIILGISAFICFRKLPHWFLVLHCGISILGLLLQVLIYMVSLALACFDMCSSESTLRGYWLLLGLGGFLLSVIGAFVTLKASRIRS